MTGAEPGFVPASTLPRSGLARALAEAAPPGEVTLVTPDVQLAQAKDLWNAYLGLRDAILGDTACFDVIDGGKQMNRTGSTRLALAFGLSIEEASFTEGRVQDATTGEYDYRYIVRVRVSKGSRHVDGIGSCRISEVPGKMDDGKREHFALARAWTRAAKRAIADILGGTEAD